MEKSAWQKQYEEAHGNTTIIFTNIDPDAHAPQPLHIRFRPGEGGCTICHDSLAEAALVHRGELVFDEAGIPEILPGEAPFCDMCLDYVTALQYYKGDEPPRRHRFFLGDEVCWVDDGSIMRVVGRKWSGLPVLHFPLYLCRLLSRDGDGLRYEFEMADYLLQPAPPLAPAREFPPLGWIPRVTEDPPKLEAPARPEPEYVPLARALPPPTRPSRLEGPPPTRLAPPSRRLIGGS